MKTDKMKFSYTMLWAFSLVIAFVIWQTGIIKIEKDSVTFQFSGREVEAPKDELAAKEPEVILPEYHVPEMEQSKPADWIPGTVVETEEPESDEVTESEAAPGTIYEADVSYFDDALFIGDSRTVGLREYGNLGNAEVAADVGMSCYKVFKKDFTLRSGEKMKLEELLENRQFGKIYIMLGINEISFNWDVTVQRYDEMLTRIRQLQPDAIIFLQANLHVSKKKSNAETSLNNETINRFNEMVAGKSDGMTTFYLDVNEIFDDEEGNLIAEYTSDGVHVLAKHYTEWVDWILKRAVKR